ncbi:hypothetical protein [Burkholderia ubonensis]|uniref:hypothetical protein n=1 Tax=Burkholderia ubonensis TaxID=101571 RepID=UPI00075E4A57|nr:hypothetical protein [Burkholderia ubonensis]KVG77210.1 hypothetical protein WJ34_02260 [Burkholderia ubonensis]KVH15804.1 hypothetical protein WJ37_31225 [Burkholderia ubonensis]KVH53105.1 hypothetical protein WJ38_02890 [Burkholderia ubonensis]KVH82340.1 hypothetical protein WJ43_26195 [Burkholderia ubonensis]KVM28989.1 hypothetical protein WJ55_23745 [Burkholderia ubonensis]
MLPAKIQELVVNLRERTEKGLMTWNYDDDASTVTIVQDNFKLSITYKFDDIEEVGRFNIKYTDTNKFKDYFFSTTQQYSDYEIVRSLFDSAQSSELDIDLDD